MLTLSDTSLHRILFCLNWRSAPDTLDSFRRSCKRINEQICAIGMDNAENVVFNLQSVCSSRDRFPTEKLSYTVTSEIGHKRACDADCPYCLRARIPYSPPRIVVDLLRQQQQLREEMPEQPVRRRRAPPQPVRPTITWEYANPDEMVTRNTYLNSFDASFGDSDSTTGCKNGFIVRNFARKTETIDKEASSDNFIQKFESAMNRVRSIRTLKLSGWRINTNIIQYFIQHSKLKNLRAVYFSNCVLSVPKEYFISFIRSMSIKEIYLWSRFKEFTLDDSVSLKKQNLARMSSNSSALVKLNEKCIMNAERLYIGGSQETFGHFTYDKITDNLLKRWIENEPVQVDFRCLRANFTVNGILELLKASADNNSLAAYSLESVHGTKEELALVFKATREIRKLNWKILLYGNNKWQLDVSIKNNKKFKFYIVLVVTDLVEETVETKVQTSGRKQATRNKEQKPRNITPNKNTRKRQTRNSSK